MSKKPEKFDGELAVILDRHIGSVNSVYSRGTDYHSGEFTDRAGSVILEVISLTEQLAFLKQKEGELTKQEKVLFRVKMAEVNILLDLLRESRAISSKVLTVLLEGKVKLGIWIDSVGGYTDVKENLRRITDRYDSNGGRTYTYVDVKAASAAFDIAFLGDEISALNRSVFLWHLSDSDFSPREQKLANFRDHQPLDEVTQEELVELREIIEMAHDGHQDELWQKIHHDLHNTQNPDGDVVFEGRDLHEAGLIHHCFTSSAKLREKFAHDLPSHAASHSGDFIKGLYGKIHQAISTQLDWLDPLTLALTEKMQRKYEQPKKSHRPELQDKKIRKS